MPTALIGFPTLHRRGTSLADSLAAAEFVALLPDWMVEEREMGSGEMWLQIVSSPAKAARSASWSVRRSGGLLTVTDADNDRLSWTFPSMHAALAAVVGSETPCHGAAEAMALG